jgi:UDP-N-acetylglucosamine 2-epimerase (non-hydrolysing)
MAPVILELQKYPTNFMVTVCSTGQHSVMLDSALNIFGIIPDANLSVMRSNQSLVELTSNLLISLDTFLGKLNPDIVLVHGDTTSAMVASLVAFYRHIKVGHVESGLRTHNLYSPFPEEFNRSSIGIVAKWHFAPTEAARINLKMEGISEKNIVVTGNTVIDALQLTIRNLKNSPEKIKVIRNQIKVMLGFDPETRAFILITAHRRENFGTGLENICLSISELAKNNPEINFVYPVHLNPKIKNIVENRLNSIPNVVLLEPLDYQSFTWLLSHCLLVLTDSGGIQEEAPSFGKPVLVMRDTSERPEAIEAGTARLVSTSPKDIVREVQNLINNQTEYERMAQASNPFGDGKASERIVNYLFSI